MVSPSLFIIRNNGNIFQGLQVICQSGGSVGRLGEKKKKSFTTLQYPGSNRILFSEQGIMNLVLLLQFMGMQSLRVQALLEFVSGKNSFCTHIHMCCSTCVSVIAQAQFTFQLYSTKDLKAQSLWYSPAEYRSSDIHGNVKINVRIQFQFFQSNIIITIIRYLFGEIKQKKIHNIFFKNLVNKNVVGHFKEKFFHLFKLF